MTRPSLALPADIFAAIIALEESARLDRFLRIAVDADPNDSRAAEVFVRAVATTGAHRDNLADLLFSKGIVTPADNTYPEHYRDGGEFCDWSGSPRRTPGAPCPRGCGGSTEHYSNDGHIACADDPGGD